MKKGVVHWHIFAVFAIVSIGCLVLAMKAETVGNSFKPMVTPVDRGLAAHYEMQKQLKDEWKRNTTIVGDTPSTGKAISVGLLLFGAVALTLLAFYSSKKRKRACTVVIKSISKKR